MEVVVVSAVDTKSLSMGDPPVHSVVRVNLRGRIGMGIGRISGDV